ncbi:MAG TPA: hypothetical protein VFK05_22810 [Polyangiaceae bacterium]|nr:hypothetical protein [Polyangiaceae bacterium]
MEEIARQQTQAGDRAIAARKSEWFSAMRWRRRVTAALSEAQLTFTQWLILEATRELIAEREDAVNQNAIAARAELDRSTVAQVMLRLQDRSLVSRDIDITGREMRIWLTEKASLILNRHRAQLEALSASHTDKTTMAPQTRSHHRSR